MVSRTSFKLSSKQILAGFPKQTSWLDSRAGRLPVWDAAGGDAFLEIFEIANFEVVDFTELPAFTVYKYTSDSMGQDVPTGHTTHQDITELELSAFCKE